MPRSSGRRKIRGRRAHEAKRDLAGDCPCQSDGLAGGSGQAVRNKTKGGWVSSGAIIGSMEYVDSPVLEHLNALRNEVRDFRQETREEFAALKNRVGSLEDQIANLHKQVASLHGDIAVIHARLDRIDNRLDRIETRLELVETP